jgi:hypothetical protein
LLGVRRWLKWIGWWEIPALIAVCCALLFIGFGLGYGYP